jgi:hypothetical protein
VWLLLLPLGIVLGLLLVVIIPIFIGAIWLMGSAIHWIGPVLLIWGLFMLLRGPGQRHRRGWSRWDAPPPRAARRATPPAGWDRPVRPAAGTPSPAAAPKSPESALPIDVQLKVDQIRRKAEALLGYADSFPRFSHDLYLVRRTAAEYLPRTIEAYLAVPQRQPDGVLPAPSKSALDELKEQLQLLDSKLDEIAQDLQKKDLDGLLANRRFLEERFGRRGVDDTPDAPSVDAARAS